MSNQAHTTPESEILAMHGTAMVDCFIAVMKQAAADAPGETRRGIYTEVADFAAYSGDMQEVCARIQSRRANTTSKIDAAIYSRISTVAKGIANL